MMLLSLTSLVRGSVLILMYVEFCRAPIFPGKIELSRKNIIVRSFTVEVTLQSMVFKKRVEELEEVASLLNTTSEQLKLEASIVSEKCNITLIELEAESFRKLNAQSVGPIVSGMTLLMCEATKLVCVFPNRSE
jgi:hypothetical protein